MKHNSWAVVCTCHEPTPLVVAFVAHYLALGASEIQIYLDKPQPRSQALLAHLPKVRFITCDDDYWSTFKFGRRPNVVTKRQLKNAFRAYNTTECDWLLHVDTDEFLTTRFPLDQSLAQVSPEIRQVRFKNLERSLTPGKQQSIFDGVFRTAPPHAEIPHSWLVSHDQEFTVRGFTGHVQGKSMYRTRSNVTPGIHSGWPSSADTSPWEHEFYLPTGTLLHFDGMTRRHWTSKLLRLAQHKSNYRWLKRNMPERYNQVAAILRARSPERAARHLHDRLKVLNAEKRHHLKALGLLDDTPFTPEDAISALNLPEKIDLSPEAFDAEVAAMREGAGDAAVKESDEKAAN
ncbi:glycosyltransferase family 2 protein [Aliiroseovarius crassostreae]|uniref:glycosyltransferase family 2 protein n=1 Tax=Aliiroseovarius crassostreae TaxID=154981 RepID=UPI003C7E275B